MRKKRCLVMGAGGFIGSHMVKRLKRDDCYVVGVDLKYPEFDDTLADHFIKYDLRDFDGMFKNLIVGYDNWDEIYQFAADMGGAGYVFTGENDCDIMRNSALINLNLVRLLTALKPGIKTVFYSSSACVYPQHNQLDPDNPNCEESSAYPAFPDSEYGWEKLFSERLYGSAMRNYKLDMRIARFHNIFGPLGVYDGGREKAPAALCRKVIEARDDTAITIWGDGKQTRSFLYIDECIEGVIRLMDSDCKEPINIGSDEMISIKDLAKMIIDISGKSVKIEYDLTKPLGVRGRNSDNRMIKKMLDWKPSMKLREGMEKTYAWIEMEMAK